MQIKKGGRFLGENNSSFWIRVVKALLGTLVMFFLSTWGIMSLVGLAFTNLSVEGSNTWVIISICIGIIFTIFFCTFTILDELRKKN